MLTEAVDIVNMLVDKYGEFTGEELKSVEQWIDKV